MNWLLPVARFTFFSSSPGNDFCRIIDNCVVRWKSSIHFSENDAKPSYKIGYVASVYLYGVIISEIFFMDPINCQSVEPNFWRASFSQSQIFFAVFPQSLDIFTLFILYFFILFTMFIYLVSLCQFLFNFPLFQLKSIFRRM